MRGARRYCRETGGRGGALDEIFMHLKLVLELRACREQSEKGWKRKGERATGRIRRSWTMIHGAGTDSILTQQFIVPVQLVRSSAPLKTARKRSGTQKRWECGQTAARQSLLQCSAVQ